MAAREAWTWRRRQAWRASVDAVHSIQAGARARRARELKRIRWLFGPRGCGNPPSRSLPEGKGGLRSDPLGRPIIVFSLLVFFNLKTLKISFLLFFSSYLFC